MPRLRGFAPVIDARTETLILGSFPSAASLAAGQYYAHPRNQFWRILGALLGEPLTDLPYEERLRRMLVHRVGLWDVIDACDRPGSLDADIRNVRDNDFAALRARAPCLVRIVFNGGTAARYAARLQRAGFVTACAPSTSPAHAARSIERKLELWRDCFDRTQIVPLAPMVKSPAEDAHGASPPTQAGSTIAADRPRGEQFR